jgi:hypothetical protein
LTIASERWRVTSERPNHDAALDTNAHEPYVHNLWPFGKVTRLGLLLNYYSMDLKNATAIILCRRCENDDVYADDPEANSRASGLATNAFKRDEFPGISLEQVREDMAAVLLDANRGCPGCRRMLDDS